MCYQTLFNMRSILLTFIVSLFVTGAFAQKLAGTIYSEENCASGGPVYYFYPTGEFIKVCDYCTNSPSVEVGKWKESGDNVTLSFYTEYIGKPTGNLVPTGAAADYYDAYTAEKNRISTQETMKKSLIFSSEDCSEISKHNYYKANPREFLRKKSYQDTYAFTKLRVVDPAELKAYTKAELRLMRNEIFARYGRKFKSKDLREYFKNRGVYGSLDKVSAFLSDTEQKNVDLIRAAENAK